MNEISFKLPPHTVVSVQDTANEIPWGVQMVNAPLVWNETKGDGIVVCVLDTGCDINHPDLKDRIITGIKGGQNFTMDDQGEPYMITDYHGHGTHTAGTIAASLNGLGVAGVAPNVKLLIGKVLNGDGVGSNAGITKGIRWASDWRGENGESVRVISMSLGGSTDDSTLHDAVKYAVSKGIAVVVAAGNSGDGNTGTNEYAYPGAYPETIEVGAIDSNKNLASFSNTNEQIDVVAPGVNVLSTYKDSGYATLSGTSMATPHVSGVVALLISMYEKRLNKTLTVDEIRQLLKDHSKDIGIDVKGEGFGLADLSIGYVAPKPKTVIEMWIDNPTAKVNGIDVTLLQPPTIVNNSTVTPARFVAETLGAQVDWDNDQRKVTITQY
jgi:major intracellular serine protease